MSGYIVEYTFILFIYKFSIDRIINLNFSEWFFEFIYIIYILF